MQFRYARHTSNIELLVDFYTRIIHLQILGRFEDHSGYDGVFLGKEGAGWHLEFTQSATQPEHQPDEDDLLVIYPETRAEYEAILVSIKEADLELVLPKNPYWIEHGICILDPDGFRVMLSKQQVKE